jgi:hypothetical protein
MGNFQNAAHASPQRFRSFMLRYGCAVASVALLPADYFPLAVLVASRRIAPPPVGGSCSGRPERRRCNNVQLCRYRSAQSVSSSFRKCLNDVVHAASSISEFPGLVTRAEQMGARGRNWHDLCTTENNLPKPCGFGRWTKV